MKSFTFILALTVLCISCNRNEAPTCVIQSPENGSLHILGDSIKVQVEAEDIDGMVMDVRIYLDGAGIASNSVWPYTFYMNTEGLEFGDHVLKATAFDDVGDATSDTLIIRTGTLPKIITQLPDSVGETGAVLSGNLVESGSNNVTQRGIFIGTGADPASTGTDIVFEGTENAFQIIVTDLEKSTIYFYCAYAINEFGTAYGDIKLFKTISENEGYVIDIEDNLYSTVKIGNQWWMAENLQVTKYTNGVSIEEVTDAVTWSNKTSPAFCYYENSPEDASIYGALYNGYAAQKNNICPSGWRVPTNDDWVELELFLGVPEIETRRLGWGGTNQGGILKHTGLSYWESPNTGATDEYGFSALPGGLRRHEGAFDTKGRAGWYWSSTNHVENEIYRWLFSYEKAEIARSTSYSEAGHSIRCIKNQ